ncbi:G-protein coupled receptor Mth2-like isoform X2 [Lutzomyia longipalpis]|uniref:Putative g protein-coupled receptor n=1 Tax=Lutzomyia longipalpis TaxID=7200 RepID=A0A7G3ACR5_LUTLO|nr:G-protein coupled receptor Mth2-like isoform X2 [Lutzomyia longipalpis]
MEKEKVAVVVVLALVLLQWCPVAPQTLVKDSLSVPCPYFDTINITGGVYDANGNILFDGILYQPDQYGTYDYEMVNRTLKFPVESHIRGCICNIKGNCVKYCCPRGYIYSHGECSRYNGSKPILLPIHEEDGNVTNEVNIEERFGIVYGKPCGAMYDLDPDAYPEEAYEIHYNGHLKVDKDSPKDKNEYCIALMNTQNSTVENPILTTKVFVCFPDQDSAKFVIYPIGMLLSVPFLVVTFLVYAIIPELRNLHGKCLMCYVLSLTIGYTLLSLIHLAVVKDGFPCTFVGFTAYFSFLISFFWLNVMCIDIWWTFRGVRGIQRDADRKKFIIYSVYAWGCAIVILSIALTLQFTDAIPNDLRPGIGAETCFLKSTKLTEFFYLYFPVIILISINLILFALTSIQIRKLQKETAAMNKGDSRRFNKMEADRDRFGLYLRLFIVMGVTWTMEVISWLIDPKSWIFYITDVCNCLQGFFIFMLFVWKPKIKKLIIKRYRSYRGLPVSSKTSRSSTRTSTSHVSMAATSSNNRYGMSTKSNNNSVSEKSHFMTEIGD